MEVETQTKSRWRQMNYHFGDPASTTEIDPTRLVKVDTRESGVEFTYRPEAGDPPELMLVAHQAVWTLDPETKMLDVCLTNNLFVKPLTKQDSSDLFIKLVTDGIEQQEMDRYFR